MNQRTARSVAAVFSGFLCIAGSSGPSKKDIGLKLASRKECGVAQHSLCAELCFTITNHSEQRLTWAEFDVIGRVPGGSRECRFYVDPTGTRLPTTNIPVAPHRAREECFSGAFWHWDGCHAVTEIEAQVTEAKFEGEAVSH